MKSIPKRYLLAFSVAPVLVWGLISGYLFIKPELSLLGDNAKYLILADNLLKGEGFVKSYLLNSPEMKSYDHRLFVMLLSWLKAFLNNDLSLIKWCLFLLSLAGAGFLVAFLPRESLAPTIYATSAFVLSPYFLKDNTDILTEPVFIFLLFSGLQCYAKLSKNKKHQYVLAFILLLIITSIVFVRLIGLALALAIFIHMIHSSPIGLSKKKFALFSGLLFFALIIGASIFDGQIFHELTIFSPLKTIYGFLIYTFAGMPMLFLGVPANGFSILYFFGLIFLIIAIYFFWRDLKKNKGVGELFCLIYFTIILIPGYFDERYLLVLMPFLYYHFFAGIHSLQAEAFINSRLGKSVLFMVWLLVNFFLLEALRSVQECFGIESDFFGSGLLIPLITVIIINLVFFTVLRRGPPIFSSSTSFRAFFHTGVAMVLGCNFIFSINLVFASPDEGYRRLAVKAATIIPSGEIMTAAEPPLIYYYSGRPTAPSYPRTFNQQLVREFLKRHHVRYLLVYRGLPGDPDGLYLLPALNGGGYQPEVRYRNGLGAVLYLPEINSP